MHTKTRIVLSLATSLLSLSIAAKIPEKPMVIVIPSRNNESLCQKNLASVFMQQYENYRVIYIDDESTDDTLKLVLNTVEEQKQWHRCTIVSNKRRRGHMYNHCMAVHRCPNNAIIVNLDGDDTFAHNDVLNRINEVYQNDDVLMTYGQYTEWPSGRTGMCRTIPAIVHEHNAYRYFDFVTSHLRTFYAGLFKAIPFGYFLYKDDFLPSAVDCAMMFSMLELSGGRAQFIDEILYIYNCANPQNIFRTGLLQQMTMAHISRGRQPLKPLTYDPRIVQHKKTDVTDLAVIIFSHNNAGSATKQIDVLSKAIDVKKDIYLLYEATTDAEKNTYAALAKTNTNCTLLCCSDGELKKILVELCTTHHYGHILLMSDDIVLKDGVHLDMPTIVRLLTMTHAVGFHLNLGKNSVKHNPFFVNAVEPPLVAIEHGIYAWKFQEASGEWLLPYALDGVVYTLSDFYSCIEQCTCSDIDNFKSTLHMLRSPKQEDVGLCFAESVMENIGT
jgi:glycosyl transferase family 2